MFGYPTSARRLLADVNKGATVQGSVWLVLAITLAMAPAAPAQTVAFAQLSGTVTDDSGAAIPGVEVSVTQTDTGFTRSVITDERGEYSLPSLPLGPYKLVAKLPGFSTFEQSGILLRVGDTRSVNVTLKVGSVQERVEVLADAGLVETQSLSVGAVTSHEVLVDLPLNGRQATQLLLLEGAVDSGGATAANRGYPGQVSISVAGGTGNSTQYLVSGVDPYLSTPAWVSNHTQLQWINMAAFANPAPGQRGDARRGTIFGPGFWNADLAFSRIVNLGESRRVELRIEAFNLFNHVNWANPNVTVDNATAGRITNTSGDPRIMQFALKYAF